MSSFIFLRALPRPDRPVTEADILASRVASHARWSRRRFWLRLRRQLLGWTMTRHRPVRQRHFNPLKTRCDSFT